MDKTVFESHRVLTEPAALTFVEQLIQRSNKTAKEVLNEMEEELLALKQC